MKVYRLEDVLALEEQFGAPVKISNTDVLSLETAPIEKLIEESDE